MHDSGVPLTAEALARYSRHVRLPGVGVEGQQKLRDTRVLLIGLGGLGSPAALYLAAAGVGTLGLAEFDRVELHNLQRQVLHDTPGVGTPKLASARARLLALNPGVTLVDHPEGVTVGNAVDLFSQYDLILDGSDNFPTRYLANDAAFFARRPLIHGSIFQFEGQVAVFDPQHGGPCYRCLFPKMPAPGTVPNCEQAGVFGALCGVIGSWQVLEAIKYRLGLGEPLRGRLLVIDALDVRARTVAVKRDPACPLCGEHPSITGLKPEAYVWSCASEEQSMSTGVQEVPLETDVKALHSRLAAGDAPLLLDVREPYEVAICKLPGAVAIPRGQLPQRLGELPRDREIVTYCHHGMRSLAAARLLRERGFTRVSSLRGGIDAWADKVEPAMPRY